MTRQTYRCGIPLFIALFFVSPQLVDGGNLLDQTGCSICCPECKHRCKLTAEKVDVEKKGYDVETKVICIPRVVFPWQKAKKQSCASCDACSGRGCSACIHNGARTRKICVLKSESYKCPECEYTWSAEPKECCGNGCGSNCGGGCGSGCTSGGCASPGCASPGCSSPACASTGHAPSPPNSVPEYLAKLNDVQ